MKALNRASLDPADREVLDGITSKQLDDLTPGDKAVLRARKPYLSEAEVRAFAPVFKVEKPAEVKPGNVTADPKPATPKQEQPEVEAQ